VTVTRGATGAVLQERLSAVTRLTSSLQVVSGGRLSAEVSRKWECGVQSPGVSVLGLQKEAPTADDQ